MSPDTAPSHNNVNGKPTFNDVYASIPKPYRTVKYCIGKHNHSILAAANINSALYSSPNLMFSQCLSGCSNYHVCYTT